MSLGVALVSVMLAAVVWWGPGWLFGEALGVRRILLPAVAPVMSLGLLSAIGIIGTPVGLPWAPLPVLLVVLLVSAVAHAGRTAVLRARRLPAGDADEPASAGVPADAGTATGRRGGPPPTTALTPSAVVILVGGLLVGAVVGAVTWLKGSAFLSGINQDWDIPWHANMVRLIASSEVWDPGIAGNFAYYDTVIAEAPIRGYPIAFHAALSLVWPMSGAPIPGFINAMVLVLVAIQLPLSAMALAAMVTRYPVAIAAAGAVSTWFAGFPYDMLWRGPLVPLVAGLVLVGPFGLLASRGAVGRRWWWTLGAAVGAVGILSIHPSLAFVAGVVLTFWFLGRIIARRGRVLGETVFLAVSGALAVVIGWPVISWMLGESERVSDVTWAADTDLRGAVDNLIYLHHGSVAVPLGTAMVAVGLLAMIARPRTWWYLGPVGLAAWLAAYMMGLDDERFLWATAPFYDDQWRTFGIYIMLIAPIAGLGVFQVARTTTLLYLRLTARGAASRERRSTRPRERRTLPVTAAVAAVLVGLAGLVSIPVFKDNVNRVSPSTVVAGPTLSVGEVRLLTSISTWVPEDATVLNDSCDGSVWMYALGDRMPMIRHFEVLPTNRQLLLWERFPDLAEDPAVRQAAAEMGIEWVYVADGRIRAWDEPKAGLESLDDLPFLTLVAREDNASLYRIDWAEVPGGVEQLDPYRANLLRRSGVAGVWENAAPDSIAELGWIC